jgi:[acyl-carrier-protein] S-malonyltransferase
MGKSLCAGSASARALYEEASRVLGWDLARICFEGPDAELTQTRVCQPALFVHGLAVLAIIRDRGLLGDATFALGLSLGEITALTAAGVFDFATGLRVVAERGRLMQLACEQSSGTMASIIGEERGKVGELCREFGVEMANLNCPGQIVISGEKTRINAAVAAGRDRGMRKVIPLNVAGAYHSRLMEPARAAFAAFLAGITFNRPNLTVFTNTTGRAVAEPEEIRTALVKQIVSPVLWEDCLRAAAGAGATEFWELGPGAVLAGLARRTDRSWPVRSFAEWTDFAA